MESRKRKLNILTVSEKVRLIETVEKGVKKKKDIAEEFGIPANTLSTILKNKYSIIRASKQNLNCAKRKRLKESSYPNLEAALLEWFRAARDQNLSISGQVILQKAQEYAKKLNYPNFKATILK